MSVAATILFIEHLRISLAVFGKEAWEHLWPPRCLGLTGLLALPGPDIPGEEAATIAQARFLATEELSGGRWTGREPGRPGQ
jgi:hypothetical protein